MTQPRTYKKPHSSKLKPADQAAADYAQGIYINKRSVFSPEFQEYEQAYKDLTLMEEFEETQLGEMA